MIIDDPDDADAKAPGQSTRMSTTTLGTLDENVTHNTLAWSRLLLDRANASDLTLVPPRGENAREPTVLVFSQESVFNATISLAGWPIYRLKSDTRGMTTDVFSAGNAGEEMLVCSYERRMIGSVLRWSNEEKVKVRKYIRPAKSRPEGARHAAVFDFDGTTYEWRIDMMGKMACYVEGAPMIDPIAWFNRSKRTVQDGRAVIRPAAMGMKEEVAFSDLRDQIVITWIVVSETARTWPYNITSA